MQLLRHKNFTKQYQRLTTKQKSQVDKAISLFCANSFDKKLRNHSLKGDYQHCRSIDAAFDLRIIFKQEKDYAIVIFLKIGSHSQLY